MLDDKPAIIAQASPVSTCLARSQLRKAPLEGPLANQQFDIPFFSTVL